MKLFAIGFTQKSAEQFFGLPWNASARRVVDVRLNNVSQLREHYQATLDQSDDEDVDENA